MPRCLLPETSLSTLHSTPTLVLSQVLATEIVGCSATTTKKETPYFCRLLCCFSMRSPKEKDLLSSVFFCFFETPSKDEVHLFVFLPNTGTSSRSELTSHAAPTSSTMPTVEDRRDTIALCLADSTHSAAAHWHCSDNHGMLRSAPGGGGGVEGIVWEGSERCKTRY